MLDILRNIFNSNYFKETPPFDSDFIMSLKEKYWPKFLKKYYLYNLPEKKDLNLKNPRTFAEKIQWLKLYDNLPIKTTLTDKILVRDFVKEHIGEGYLKNILWVGKNFDEIPFESLPEKFYIKTNHGCKWHIYIKNKDKFLQTKILFLYIKNKFDKWMSSNYFPLSFEPQYKNIIPQLYIEESLKDENNPFIEIEVICCNGRPRMYRCIRSYEYNDIDIFDEYFVKIYGSYRAESENDKGTIEKETLKEISELSEKLAKQFKFVRVDWIFYNNKIYFNEMTFTPASGYYHDEMFMSEEMQEIANSILL